MYAETYPSFHSSHYMLALALEANGDTEGAIASLERALEIHLENGFTVETDATFTAEVVPPSP